MVFNLTPEQADDVARALDKEFDEWYEYVFYQINLMDGDEIIARLNFLDSLAAGLSCVGGTARHFKKASLTHLFNRTSDFEAVKMSRLYERYTKM